MAGNPLYAVELTAALRRSGWRVGAALPVPDRLDGLLADRMGRLPARAAEPLAVVASLAAPTVALVADALGTTALAGLDDAVDAEVLYLEEGRLRFAHPLLGVAALARLRPSTRLALHARLAAVATDDEERAHHLIQAATGPDATWRRRSSAHRPVRQAPTCGGGWACSSRWTGTPERAYACLKPRWPSRGPTSSCGRR